MAEEEEKERGFKVADRRRFSAEGEAKPEVEEKPAAEPAKPIEKPAAAHSHAEAHSHSHDEPHSHSHDEPHIHCAERGRTGRGFGGISEGRIFATGRARTSDRRT